MKISCVIPTCDRAEYLIETLKSVLAQSEAPSEIIVVNNGAERVILPENISGGVNPHTFWENIKSNPKDCIVSTAPPPQNGQTSKDVGIKVFDIIPYAGVAQARNFGASMANGDYLAFLDDDDLWNPEYLKNAALALKNERVDCVISRIDYLRGEKIESFRNPHGNISIQNILIANPGITGSNLIISKNAFFKLRGFDPKLPPSEDKSLILEALLNNFKIKTLPENQALWRAHDAAPRLTDAAKMAEGIFQFTRKYRGLMTKKQYLINWQKIYAHRYDAGEKFAYLQYLSIRIVLVLFKL